MIFKSAVLLICAIFLIAAGMTMRSHYLEWRRLGKIDRNYLEELRLKKASSGWVTCFYLIVGLLLVVAFTLDRMF